MTNQCTEYPQIDIKIVKCLDEVEYDRKKDDCKHTHNQEGFQLKENTETGEEEREEQKEEEMGKEKDW